MAGYALGHIVYVAADTVYYHIYFYRWRHAPAWTSRMEYAANEVGAKRNGEEAHSPSAKCVCLCVFDAIHQKQFRQFIGDLRLLVGPSLCVTVSRFFASFILHISQFLMDV